MIKRIMTSTLLTAGLWAGLGVTSATALSCMPPDLTRSMENAKASEKLYYIFVGKLELVSKRKLPRTDIPAGSNARDFPRAERAKMRFTGYSLAADATRDQRLVDLPMEVETSCAAHWCGGLPATGQKIIAFVEAPPNGPPRLRIGPCPQWVFHTQPSDGQVETLRRLF